jgi:molybdate transport system substrate-binding protein
MKAKQDAVARTRILRCLAAFVVLLLGVGVVSAQNLTVFAAASLKEALDEVGREFQRTAASDYKLALSFASSAALAKQIENGAPADIFISADLDWMDYLDQRKLIKAGTRANLLRNRLVLIAPADSKVQLEIKPGFALATLLGDGKLSMADPDSVPAGKYAKAALEKLGVWGGVERKVARGDNVRLALIFVARGEAPLGIVYRTDAIVERKVRVVAEFPADTHAPIIYPVAVIASSKHAMTPVFMKFLKSKDARTIFEKYGFGVEP